MSKLLVPSRLTRAGKVFPSSSWNAGSEALEIAVRDLVAGHHPIGLVHAVAGMGQAIGKLAVVAEQHQTGRIGVEPTNRVQP